MAERTKLESYIVFSFLNTVVFSIPSHWTWSSNGWLAKLGVIDIAGMLCKLVFHVFCHIPGGKDLI